MLVVGLFGLLVVGCGVFGLCIFSVRQGIVGAGAASDSLRFFLWLTGIYVCYRSGSAACYDSDYRNAKTDFCGKARAFNGG